MVASAADGRSQNARYMYVSCCVCSLVISGVKSLAYRNLPKHTVLFIKLNPGGHRQTAPDGVGLHVWLQLWVTQATSEKRKTKTLHRLP